MVVMEDVTYIDWTSLVLVIIGALNWGLTGLGNLLGQEMNLVNLLLGGVMSGQVEAGIYILVGIAGLYQVYFGYQMMEE
jgi:uncharacterized membrane protein YuzA (DUF378 family)